LNAKLRMRNLRRSAWDILSVSRFVSSNLTPRIYFTSSEKGLYFIQRDNNVAEGIENFLRKNDYPLIEETQG